MREAFIQRVIEGFSRFYGYGVIEIDKHEDLSSNWALVKNLDVDTKKVIVFTTNSLLNKEDLKLNLLKDLNCSSVQLVQLLTVSSEELVEEGKQFMYEEEAITVDYSTGKLLAYGFRCEDTAQELANLLNYYSSQSREKKRDNEKSWVTYSLIFINIGMYILTAFLSGNLMDSDINVLVLLGAKVNELISAGEYYRLAACMFLHGGIIHLALNMYALYSIGPLVEKVYGIYKYIFIYFISGILSSLLSFKFSEGVSIGASGAIFGLLGATLVFALKRRKNIGRDFIKNIASVIIINLFIGFSMPNIDNFGHIGGLIGGAAAALILDLKRKK